MACRAALVALCGWLLALGPATAQDATGRPSPELPSEAFNEYVIGPGDVLEIDVFELAELSKKVRVTGRGSISYPMLGVIDVAGLTKQQLEARMRDLLAARYVRDPQVTVFLAEVRSGTVAVLGAVNKPGSVDLLSTHSVLEVLSQAGGISDDAGSKAYLVRAGKSSEPLLVDLRRLMESGDLSFNLPVGPGDVLYVPKIRTYRVFVYGQVEEPGAFEIKEDEAVTVLQAVAMAGGLARRAKAGKVKIVRRERDGESTRQLKIDLGKVIAGKSGDVALQEGDIVVVPKSFF